MTRQIGALLAAALLAAGLASGAAPASADEKTPWYMPQAWVHPPSTGPSVRPQAGYYGYTRQNNAYGGFANGCYGTCGNLPGTVVTANGVVLSRPVVAIYDGDDYQLVSREQLGQLQAQASRQAAAYQQKAGGAAAAPARHAQRPAQKQEPKFSVQNGVRIIRPSTSMY
ncbi:MAG TPA: hypothetical protein VFE34_05290 [Dongiaceae bacterium]|nr:hypothetical protein [Dongiaceae bacterium]